jgi:nucleoside-diphosphate-sugar epimerase
MVYEEAVQRARKLVASGAIGEVVSVEACHVQNARRDQALLEEGAQYFYWSYRLNGGPLQDWIPHMASLVFEFVPEIRTVQSVSFNRGVLPKGWDDELRVLVASERVTGLISISLSERPDMITFQIKGTRGVIHVNLFNGLVIVQKHSTLPRAAVRGLSGFQAAHQLFWGSVKNIFKFLTGHVDKTSGIGSIVPAFYKAIQKGGDLPISVEKSLRVVELMNKLWPNPRVIEEPKEIRAASDSQKVPTVLITGASGFLGIHLIKKLMSENIRARVLIRKNSIHLGRLRNLDVEIVQGDLSDPRVIDQAVKGIKIIYHAGAAMNNSWYDHEQATIVGTQNIIKSALAHGVERIVYVSTLAVYELNSLKDRSVVNEDTPYQKEPKKMGPYAYTKIEAEKILLKAYQESGLKVTIVRPGIIIGPMGRVFFPHLGFKNADSLFIILKNGKNRLPLTFVENTVDAIYRASLEPQAVGKIYNLVDDGNITVRDYLTRFKEVTGIDSKIVRFPFFVPYCAFGVFELAGTMGLMKKGKASRAQFKWKHKNVVFDNRRAKADLDWEQKVPMEEGLRRTFEWYLEHCRS